MNHEALISRGPKILPESFARDIDRVSYPRFLAKHFLRRRRSLARALWVVDNFSPDNYFHWTTEALARLSACDSIDAPVLVPAYYRRSPYVEFTLRAFPHPIEVIDKWTEVRVGQLLKPQSRESGTYGPEIRLVADRLRHLAGNAADHKKVYLARVSGRRQIANEPEVADFLRDRGFERIVIDPSDPGEQIRVASNAEVLVGIHGAALTNVMFMRTGRLIELRHGDDGIFFDCFRPLAEAVGVLYTPVLCKRTAEVHGYDANHSDLHVDIDALDAALADHRWASGPPE